MLEKLNKLLTPLEDPDNATWATLVPPYVLANLNASKLIVEQASSLTLMAIGAKKGEIKALLKSWKDANTKTNESLRIAALQMKEARKTCT